MCIYYNSVSSSSSANCGNLVWESVSCVDESDGPNFTQSNQLLVMYVKYLQHPQTLSKHYVLPNRSGKGFLLCSKYFNWLKTQIKKNFTHSSISFCIDSNAWSKSDTSDWKLGKSSSLKTFNVSLSCCHCSYNFKSTVSVKYQRITYTWLELGLRPILEWLRSGSRSDSSLLYSGFWWISANFLT